MHHLIKATAVSVFVFLRLSSAQAADLNTYQETYAKNAEQILKNYQTKFERLPQQYQKALEDLNISAREQGNLVKLMAARAEIERFKNARSLPAKPETNTVPEILSLQTGYVRHYNRLEQEMTAELSTLVKQYLQALGRLQTDLVRSNQLEKALEIKAECDNKQTILDGYAKQLAALKETALPPEGTPPSPQAAQLVEVDSSMKRGTWLGSFKKGQTLVFQYVEGAWMLNTSQPEAWPEKSPDAQEPVQAIYRCALCKSVDDQFITLTLLPGNTARNPFRYSLQEDGEIWIMCNDGQSGNTFENNRGTAKYQFSVE